MTCIFCNDERGPLTPKCPKCGSPEPLRKQLDSQPLQRGQESKPIQGTNPEGEPLRK